ncbi:hypothetical protein BO78DRAFT_193499 [Aspergillus sclerotiicarbonarius CBS 121057]|uniref:Uncharacterized protein n=1 Tax=Aspergillus sclerotiicarbonarius (strain CBS 121057 / IBT 28362) TaxID=1448318 RepID=A0A319EIU5_ASPSB|nr:hypothetical protein BO78DRAFT_193499 [Aspergillus sclerotiicarbonarius CBS 121057]
MAKGSLVWLRGQPRRIMDTTMLSSRTSSCRGAMMCCVVISIAKPKPPSCSVEAIHCPFPLSVTPLTDHVPSSHHILSPVPTPPWNNIIRPMVLCHSGL